MRTLVYNSHWLSETRVLMLHSLTSKIHRVHAAPPRSHLLYTLHTYLAVLPMEGQQQQHTCAYMCSWRLPEAVPTIAVYLLEMSWTIWLRSSRGVYARGNMCFMPCVAVVIICARTQELSCCKSSYPRITATVTNRSITNGFCGVRGPRC